MVVYLYIHNTYTQYTRIYYVKKTTFILDVINRLTALIIIIIIIILIIQCFPFTISYILSLYCSGQCLKLVLLASVIAWWIICRLLCIKVSSKWINVRIYFVKNFCVIYIYIYIYIYNEGQCGTVLFWTPLTFIVWGKKQFKYYLNFLLCSAEE